MVATGLSKAVARRSLVVSLVIIFTLLFAAVPAYAKPGGSHGNGASTPSASMTLSPSQWYPNNPCSFDATYTWSGFKGNNLNVAVRLLDGSGNTLAVPPQVTSVPGSGSFTFIFTFDSSGGSQQDITARGALLASGTEVSGSVASSPLVPTTCTGQISIGWVTTISLT